MADGHVNKCKECNKHDVRENRKLKVDYYREYDAYRYRVDDKIKNRNLIYKSKNTPSVNIHKVNYIARNPEKRAAHIIVGNAVRDGRLYKPNNCSACGEFTPSRVLHAHHDDYAKPLEVVWLCSSCHGYEHSKYKHLYKNTKERT